MQALFMNLLPPSSRFFFSSGPKKVLSISLNVKCDQQTHKKVMSPIMASISGKLFNKVIIIIFQMLLAFLWVQGGFYGFDYGKSKYYGFGLLE
jgi:hypothetical protein